MKTRKVIVTMEIETVSSLKSLKDEENWGYFGDGYLFLINKIQVNVVKKKVKK